MATTERRKPVTKRPTSGRVSQTQGWFRRNWRPLVSVVVLLILWQIIGSQLNPIFLSTPVLVGHAFWELTVSGELLRNFVITVQIFIAGLALATVVGIPLGLIAGRYTVVSQHSDIVIRTFYSLPTIALFPLFIVWFGINEGFRLALVFFSGVFPLIITSQAGVRSVDPVLIDVARIAGANERDVFLKIVVPSVLAFIAAGFKLAIGRAIITTVAMELLTSIRGLGGMMSLYGNNFQTAKYFAPLIATTALSFAAFWFGDRLERRFSKWRPTALN